MVRRVVVDAVGPLDEGYWLYTEEADWCYHARRAGWQVALVPQARVFHFCKAASRQQLTATTLHFYSSRVLFIRKHSGRAQALIAQGIYASKALIWLLLPMISPLQVAHPDVSRRQMRQTYRALWWRMAVPWFASQWP
jgi:GT2 family glycosyltransferase